MPSAIETSRTTAASSARSYSHEAAEASDASAPNGEASRGQATEETLASASMRTTLDLVAMERIRERAGEKESF